MNALRFLWKALRDTELEDWVCAILWFFLLAITAIFWVPFVILLLFASQFNAK